MTIKWYNRDSISDVEMKQARLVAERLQGKKEGSLEGVTIEHLQEAYRKANFFTPRAIKDYLGEE